MYSLIVNDKNAIDNLAQPSPIGVLFCNLLENADKLSETYVEYV